MTLHDLKNPLSGDMCLLCGGKPDVIGAFVPERPEDFGGMPGKVRIFRYCLCSACQAKPDARERVEKVILAELAGGATHAS